MLFKPTVFETSASKVEIEAVSDQRQCPGTDVFLLKEAAIAGSTDVLVAKGRREYCRKCQEL